MIAVTDSSNFSVVAECPNCAAVDNHDWVGISGRAGIVVRQCNSCEFDWIQK